MLKFDGSTSWRVSACFLLFTAFLVPETRPAAAMEQTIVGHTLRISDPKPGVDPSLRRLYARAKERRSSNTIDGDPITNGATLEIRLNGSHPTSQLFSLAGGTNGNGRPFWRAISGGFIYRDQAGENGAVSQFRINKARANGLFTMSVSLSGKNAAMDLVPPAPGADASMVLSILGEGGLYCVQYGPEANVQNRGDKSFKVAHPELEGCPPCTTGPGIDDGEASTCADAASGTTCTTWACNAGYVKAGTDPFCVAGNWSGTYACEPAPCDAAPPIDNGASTCEGTESGDRCTTWSCDSGYVPQGGDPLCTRGTWSGSYSCKPAPCDSAPQIDNGSSASCRGTRSGTTCMTWICQSNHVRRGSDPLCTRGVWSGSYRCVETDPPR